MKFDLNNALERNKYDTYSNKLKLANNKVELKKLGGKRSISINSYLHVCISIYSIEFGYTLAESKVMLKRECGFMVYEKKGLKFLIETSKQTNEECSKFVEFIRNYSAKQGLYIPDATEYKENKFAIDREIDRHKEFL
tara:strand:+ start:5117 stop:5530 length:414 start_codon:yes stop_codon:yes gene_type:complete